MHTRCVFAASLALATLFADPSLAQEVVTVYSADGLHDGTPNWYQTQFDAFTKATGIKVQYIEAGSGGVVERVAKEATNPQADVLVTLPPFVMKAVADGLIQAYTPAGADQISDSLKDKGGMYVALSNNYMNFIYNASVIKEPPKTFGDLLDPKFKGKLQYSTPGQAGDGTAVMIEVFHAFGGKDKGFEFLKALKQPVEFEVRDLRPELYIIEIIVAVELVAQSLDLSLDARGHEALSEQADLPAEYAGDRRKGPEIP